MIEKVYLTGLTQPSAYTGCRTAAELVAYIARVSNPGNQNNTKTAPKLLKYLIKNNHWSPFECVNITMEVTTTRDISRQILRHRSFSFQEYSQRYAVSGDFINNREARIQDPKNRQNSIRLNDRNLQEEWNMMQVNSLKAAHNSYHWALDNAIAKEQARAVLPEGLTLTKLFIQGSLRSWIHYCTLRRANGTQLEHSEIAKQAWDIIRIHFPDVVEAVEEIERDKEEVNTVLIALLKIFTDSSYLTEITDEDMKLIQTFVKRYLVHGL